MTEPETNLIQSPTPKREWLLRCGDNSTNRAMCSICVSDGDIEIYSPGDDRIMLDSTQIAYFHLALHEAINLAETDLRRRRREFDTPAREFDTPAPEFDTPAPEFDTPARGLADGARGR